MKELKETKVFSLRLDPKVIKRIKLRCVERNESIKNWATRIMIEQLAKEESYSEGRII